MRASALFVLSAVVFSLFVAGQETAVSAQDGTTDPWGPLAGLVGTWEGSSDGKFGPATLQTTWQFVFGGKFLQSRTRSVSGKGVHEDLGMLSYDKNRERFVLREFYSEGYVNQFLLTFEDDGATLVFETESVENAYVPTLSVRTTITFDGNDLLRGTLALGSEGQPLETCISSQLTRKEGT